MNTADRYQAVRDSLLQGFDWEASPQGSDYWRSVYDTLAQNIRYCKEAEARVRFDTLKVGDQFRLHPEGTDRTKVSIKVGVFDPDYGYVRDNVVYGISGDELVYPIS